MRKTLGWLAGAIATMCLVVVAMAREPEVPEEDRFGHAKHANLFPLCTTCHAGAITPGAVMMPEPASCGVCHDGVAEDEVEWSPRTHPRRTNVRFEHLRHGELVGEGSQGDTTSALRCWECHTEAGSERMEVRHAVAPRCVACHDLPGEHLAAPDSACTTCHLTLAEATTLRPVDVAAFPTPPNHLIEGFGLTGHGPLAGSRNDPVVAARCATCHARNFCLTCHVDGPESGPIQALASDERSLAIEATLPVPTTHESPEYLTRHGTEARRGATACATCHTQESCATCHAGNPPSAVAALHRSGPGRGPGAQLTRTPPSSHTWEFTDRHAAPANASPSTCQNCHVRPDCLQCHRPDPAGGSGYHPQGFLTRHPSASWAREASCSDCHNPGQFCQSCHQQSGLTAIRRLGVGGYHDAWPSFSLGHGQAARQSLEACASCHTAERDCTTCHSSVGGGFRFSPHGPGFNPERMQQKNPSLCRACHGTAVPSRP